MEKIFSRLPLELRREVYSKTLVGDDATMMVEEILDAPPSNREVSSNEEENELQTAIEFHIHKATASARKDALSFFLAHNTILMYPSATSPGRLLALTQDLSKAGLPNKVHELDAMIEIRLVSRGSEEFKQFGQAPSAYNALKALSQLEQLESINLILQKKKNDRFDIRNDKLWGPINDIRDRVLANSEDPEDKFQVSVHISLPGGGQMGGQEITWMWDPDLSSEEEEF
ncbi:hypothetical protein MMC10_009649 [Thelotrema lepadinum]|nr:hypothetical protein [Thelotrema lepadinum]